MSLPVISAWKFPFPNWAEVLDLSEQYLCFFRLAQNSGLDELRKTYSTVDERMKVSCVIFVSSIQHPVPDHLITCVVDAAQPNTTDRGNKTRRSKG